MTKPKKTRTVTVRAWAPLVPATGVTIAYVACCDPAVDAEEIRFRGRKPWPVTITYDEPMAEDYAEVPLSPKGGR
jgi:hypothetical protein